MKLNILLLILFFYSCENNHNPKIIDNKPTIVKRELKPKKYQNFEQFWKEFGIAIKNVDTNKIKLLVEVPLKIRGRDDHDPEINLNNGDIIRYFLYIVNKGGYYDYEKDSSISNKNLLLSDLSTISDYNKYTKIQWIKDFVFMKTPQGWKLILLYTDTKDLKKILK